MKAGHLARALVLTIVLAPVADAAQITVLCMPGMRAAMEELGPQLEGATGHKLSIRFGTTSQSRESIESGAFDLVTLDSGVVDDLIKQNKVIGTTRAVVGRMGIGVAVRAGGPKPDITTIDEFTRDLALDYGHRIDLRDGVVAQFSAEKDYNDGVEWWEDGSGVRHTVIHLIVEGSGGYFVGKGGIYVASDA